MIATTFDLFYVPGYCVEVRALGVRGNNPAWEGWAGGTVSGYFDNKDTFIAAVEKLDQATPEGIYITLNPVLPDLLARAHNRLKPAKRGETTHDNEIAKRGWVLLDFDPVRPSGISASQMELDLAYYAARECWLALKAKHGEGIIAMSGNGVHLLYRTDASNDDQTTRRLANYLKEISQTYGNEKVTVDTSVFNAARITKLYGTAARKGENTKQRPHRRSTLMKMPETIGVISLDMLPTPPPKEMTTGEAVERIESALAVLPAHFGPNSYDRWVSVLMATHAELGDAAIPLLERYVPGHEGEIAAKCAGFNGAGTNINTLYAIAKEYGWQPTTHQPVERYDEPTNVPTAAEIELLFGDGGLPFSLYSYRPEEGGVLDAFLDHYADNWRFFLTTGTWHTWTGSYWQPDQVGSVAVEIQTLLLLMNDEAHLKLAQCTDKEEQKIWRSYIGITRRTSARVNSIENMLKPHITVDASPNNKLNLSNGTLDLDTFAFTDHDRGDGLDYVLPYAYDPQAQCPRFLQFLQEILVYENTTTTDMELLLLMQELIGYSLTTQTQRQVMAWLSGDGNNGKSILIEVIQQLLGPMAVNVDFQVLGTQGNYDMADLPNKRVAFATEADASKSFADGVLKRVVSGEKLRARHIKQKQFEFRPVAKVWWAMNDKPRARYSHSIWRRLILIPFYRVLNETEIDVYLSTKLLQELSGILNFALAGLQRLNQNNRFTQAAAVAAAKDEYALESNPVMQWREERTEDTPIPTTLIGTLYEDYRVWCVKTGHGALADNNFAKELNKLRVPNERRTSGRYYALNINGEKLSIEIPVGLGL